MELPAYYHVLRPCISHRCGRLSRTASDETLPIRRRFHRGRYFIGTFFSLSLSLAKIANGNEYSGFEVQFLIYHLPFLEGKFPNFVVSEAQEIPDNQ